jgi:copper chaperone CopZ
MSNATTQCAKEIITGLSKVDGLTAEQMLEDHLTIQKIIG